MTKAPRPVAYPTLPSFFLAAWCAVTVTLTGCTREKPDALLARAKEHLAKNEPANAIIHAKNALAIQDSGEIRFLLGRALLAGGEHAGAQIHLQQALLAGYAVEEVYPELSKALLANGEFARLAADLGRVTLTDPVRDATLKSDIGEANLALGRMDDARAAFAAARAKVPGDDRARAGEARITAATGDLAGALAVAEEILGARPGSVHGLGLKADILSAQNRMDEAIAALDSLVAAAPSNAYAQINRVSLLLSGGKLDLAATAIEQLKKSAPRDSRVKYLEGMLALRRNEPAKARDAAVAVLNFAPDHGPALLLAGAAEFQLGALATATDHLKKALQKHPANFFARNLLVAAYLRQGQPANAENALAPALSRTPNDPAVLRAAGEVAIASNRLKDAVKFYSQAHALEKGNPATLTRLAQVRLAAGETDRALADFEAASTAGATQVQSDLALISAYLAKSEFAKALLAAAALEKKLPDDPLPHSIRATIALARKDAAGARAALEKALAIRPDYIPAARVLAELDLADQKPAAATGRIEAILARDGANEGALLALAQIQAAAGLPRKDVAATYERAIKAHPASAIARLAHGNFLTQGRETAAALVAAQAAFAAIPGDPRILDLLGLAQLASGDAQAALGTFNQMAKLQPDSAVPQLRLAAASYKANQPDVPVQALRKALTLQPDLLEAQRGIVTMLLEAGKPEEALREARLVQKARAGESIGFALEGDVLEQQRKLPEAARAYAEGIRRQASPELVVKHIQLLEKSGQADEARRIATNWIRQNPDDPVVRYHVATSAMLKKQYREAADGYRAILGKNPDHLQTLNNLAWVLGELKDGGALAIAERAYRIDPNNPSVLDTYGWLLAQSGDAARGVELLRRAATAAPGEIEIRLHLAQGLAKAGDKPQARKELEDLARSAGSSPVKTRIEELLRTL